MYRVLLCQLSNASHELAVRGVGHGGRKTRVSCYQRCQCISRRLHHNNPSSSRFFSSFTRSGRKNRLNHGRKHFIPNNYQNREQSTKFGKNVVKHALNSSHQILPILHFMQSKYFSNTNNADDTNNTNDTNDTKSIPTRTSTLEKTAQTATGPVDGPKRAAVEIDRLTEYPAIDIPIEERPDWVLIGVEDCQNVFRLNDQDLKEIAVVRKYDPYDETKERHWYYLRDAWEKACQKYGQQVVQQWYQNFTEQIRDRVTFDSVSGWKSKDQLKQPSSPLWNWLKAQIKTSQSIEQEEQNKSKKSTAKLAQSITLRPLHSSNSPDGLDVVQRALLANLTKTAVMFSFYYWTQSYTLFSEALHASADSINQGMLLLAVLSAARDPDWTHPYGYGARRWVVSSLSGGVLTVMGLTSIWTGLADLGHPHAPEHLMAAATTCMISFCLELYSFLPAYKELRKNAQKQQLSLYNYLWYGTDSSTVHVFCEDSAGALCSLTALGFLSASLHFSPVWDAYGSIGIGSLLTGVGMFLGYRNTQLLSGQSVPENVLEDVLRVLSENTLVASHHDLKSMVVGVNACVIKVEVNFNADKIADRHININNIFPRFEKTVNKSDLSAFHDIMMRSCAEYQTWLTQERSNLENEIRSRVRKFGYKRVHVDIENY